jgi:hypothetical protein
MIIIIIIIYPPWTYLSLGQRTVPKLNIFGPYIFSVSESSIIFRLLFTSLEVWFRSNAEQAEKTRSPGPPDRGKSGLP